MEGVSIIEVNKLAVGYQGRDVLADINFSVYQGEKFMIIGGSGCGKTTLLSCMLGLLEPNMGKVIVDGKDMYQAGEQVKLKILKNIGVMYQTGALFGSLDLLHNVMLPLEEMTNLPQEAIVEIARDKLKMVGLEDFDDYLPGEISGGMQRRAAMARAMALDPKILFLDEPTSGLDPISASALDQLIVNLSVILGVTFVIVSHDVASICKIADRVILLQQGKIVAEGKAQDLYKSVHPFVKRFFARNIGI